jgi:hypothetical protein
MVGDGRARARRFVSYVWAPLVFAACSRSDPLADARGLLPPPPSGPLAEAVAARSPFEESPSPGVSLRTRFRGGGPLQTDVEVRDAVVAPRATLQVPPVNGVALLDLHSGHASASVGGKAVALSAGRPTSVAARTPASITNDGDGPLALRLYVVRGK